MKISAKIVAIAISTLAALPLAAQSGIPADVAKAAAAINAHDLRAAVRFLSDDLLEGRGPASRGDRLARLYLATELESIGLEPGFGGSNWEQPFDIVGINSKVPADWKFKTKGGDVSLAFWDEFIARSEVQKESASIEGARVVFVGYGIQAPEFQWDDFKGADLKGAVLLMLNDDPDWDPALFAGETRLLYGRWTYKYQIAAQKGAVGAIIIHTAQSAGYPFTVVQTSNTGVQFSLPSSGEPELPVCAWATESSTRRLLSAAGFDLDKLVAVARSRKFRPVDLGISTSLKLENKVERTSTANVAGRLRGSDPLLRDEVVVFSAHHDHLGIGAPNAKGETIFNGARDNGTGMAQVLAVARAIKALPTPPRRSILFLFPAAEEQGLLGSEYLVAHSPFPAGRIAADINFDSSNIWGRTRDITLIGPGKSSLDAIAAKFASAQGRAVVPDPNPRGGWYYRSDQFNFARIGVPGLYIKSGREFVGRPDGWGKETIASSNERTYHQTSDDLTDEWNFDGLVDDTVVAFLSGLEVANADGLPTWTPGDEFEAARKRALTEAKGH